LQRPLKIGYLISGKGYFCQKIIEACKANVINAEVVVVVSNSKGSSCKDFVENNAIDYFYLDLPVGDVNVNTEKVLDCLTNYSLDLVITTFNRILGKRFVKFYTNKAVNMHLALLPLFKGLDPVGRALNSGQSVTGASMHYITEDVDSGQIISRMVIPLDSDETRETLSEKYKFVLLPFMLNTLNLFCEDDVKVLDEIDTEVLNKIERATFYPAIDDRILKYCESVQ